MDPNDKKLENDKTEEENKKIAEGAGEGTTESSDN
tara:strand:- start:149 stop:253 length:105 start_codon:yes stop_codon:yes gene_type:complete